MEHIRKAAEEEYIEHAEKLENIWVYDDEFVKGMIHIEGDWMKELVLEKNESAIRFYQKHGFILTQERWLEQGTTEFIVKMERGRREVL